jgi:hypothetical protein
MRRLAGARIALLAAVVTALLPRVAAAVCAPSASGIFPASGLVGTNVSATVRGSGLDGVTVTVFGDPGLTAAVQATGDLAATIQLTIDPAAAAGERILLLENAGGSTGVSFTVNPAGGPVVADASPPLLATLGVPLDVTLTGANLGGLTAANFTVSGLGVTVSTATPGPDGTTLALGFSVDPAADLGTHAVVLTAPTGGAVLQLYVQRPSPLLTTVSPGAGEQGATVALTLTGTSLTGAALVIGTPEGGGSGDIVVSGVATPDDSTLTATLTIAPGAALTAEPRLLIITTESGQTTAEFFVVAPDVPSLTTITPAAGEPNTRVAVTLRGLNLTNDAMVSETTPDLTLQNVVVVDDETITLDVVVAPGATPNCSSSGTGHTLTVTTGAGSDGIVFCVVASGDPYVSAIRPPFGNRGTTFTLFVEGMNLAGIDVGDGVDLSGDPKVIATNAAAVSNTLARCTLEVELTAAAGHRDLTVNTSPGNNSFTRDSAFRVNVPGQVPLIDDVAPDTVAPGTTTAMTVTGSGFEGGAALVTGPGAVVTNIVVDPSGSVMTFDLTIAADAPDENRAVIVVTENGTARCGIGTLAAAPELVASKLVKTGAVFMATGTGFRLFVFEFSLNELFSPGPRTVGVADSDGTLVLSRLDTVNVGRAFREHHKGWVRVRAITSINRVGTSAAQVVRR